MKCEVWNTVVRWRQRRKLRPSRKWLPLWLLPPVASAPVDPHMWVDVWVDVAVGCSLLLLLQRCWKPPTCVYACADDDWAGASCKHAVTPRLMALFGRGDTAEPSNDLHRTLQSCKLHYCIAASLYDADCAAIVQPANATWAPQSAGR